MMGEGNFTWLGGLAPANQHRLGGGVVWVAEGMTLQKFSVAEQTGERMNHRHFERFGEAARRQNTWEPRGQHTLARAGWANHQQVMAACRYDLKRALGAFLPLMCREEVGQMLRRAILQLRLGRLSSCAALKWLMSAKRFGAAKTAISPVQTASLPLPAAQIRPQPSALAWTAAARMPTTGGAGHRRVLVHRAPQNAPPPPTEKSPSRQAGLGRGANRNGRLLSAHRRERD